MAIRELWYAEAGPLIYDDEVVATNWYPAPYDTYPIRAALFSQAYATDAPVDDLELVRRMDVDGTANTLLKADATSKLPVDSAIVEDGTNVVIAARNLILLNTGTSNIGSATVLWGTVYANAFRMPTGAGAGKFIQGDADGDFAWEDVDDVPVDGAATIPISSNWAYDHVAAADPHSGYLTQTEADALYAAIAHVHDAADLTYTPAVLADWSGSADPGDIDNALDQLAARLTDVEPSSHAAVTLGAGSDPALSLSGQELTLADVLTATEADLLYAPLVHNHDLVYAPLSHTHVEADITDLQAYLTAVDAAIVTYTPAVLADWNGDADPGDLDNALDQLAARVDDIEGWDSAGITSTDISNWDTAYGWGDHAGLYALVGHAHDAAAITYTPSVLTDWDSDADPGNIDAALNQLAERVDDLENAGYLTAITDHDHSGDAGDGNTFDAANLTSGAATDGYVLTADGLGGSAWEAPTGGSGVSDGDKGDITVSGSGTVWTIDNGVVTYAKMQDVSATDKILGRATAGAGDVEEITCTAAGRALLDDAAASNQRTTLGLGTIATRDVGPSFSVYKSADQAYTAASSWVKVTWGTETFDEGPCFDLANSKFQPSVAGKYLLSATIIFHTVGSIGSYIGIAIYKNGVIYSTEFVYIDINNSYTGAKATLIVDANGSTDYFEVYGVNTESADSTIISGSLYTYFSGCRVG